MSTMEPEAAAATIASNVEVALGALDALETLAGGDINALMKLEPLLTGAEKLDPKAFADALGVLVTELGKTTVAVPVDVMVDFTDSLGDVELSVDELSTFFEELEVEVSPVVEELAGEILAAMPPRLRERLERVTSRLTAATPELLAQLFTGSDLATLAAGPALAQSESAEFDTAAAPLLPVAVTLNALTIDVQDVVILLQANPPDIQLIAPRLMKIDADLDILFTNLDPLILDVAAALDAIDTTAFTEGLTSAFDTLAELLPDAPFRLSPLFDDLRDAVDELESVTETDVQDVADAVVQRIRDALAAAGIGPHLTLLAALKAKIAAVDLPGTRQQVIDALTQAKEFVEKTGQEVPADLKDAMASLRDAIVNFDDTEAGQAVQGVFTQADGFIDAYDAAVKSIEATLQQVKETAGQYIKDLTAKLKEIEDKLAALAKEVDAIDFDAAAAESQRLMAEARATVEEALADADLPPAARAALSLAAKALEELELEGQVVQPIRDELEKLDATKIAAQLEEIIQKLRDELQNIVPAAVVAQLDEPFDRVYALLQQYRPDVLAVIVQQELVRLDALLAKADPAPLIENLEMEYQKLLTTARKHADLGPLFAPVQKAYDDAVQTITDWKLEELVSVAADKANELQPRLEAAVHEALAAVGNVSFEPFQLGDVLRPWQEVVQQLRDALAAVPDPVLEAALLAVAAPLVFSEQLGDPDSDLHAFFEAELRERLVMLDFGGAGGPAVRLEAALQELESLQLDLTVKAQLGNTLVDVQLGVRLQAIATARGELEAAAQRLLDRLTPPELVASAQRLSEAIRQAVPPELLDPPEGISPRAYLTLVLDTLDVTALIAELDALGVRIDTKLRELAGFIAAAVLDAIEDVFGIADIDDTEQKLLAILTELQTQIAALDPSGIQPGLQDLADKVIEALEKFAPAQFTEDLQGVLQDVRDQVSILGGKVVALIQSVDASAMDPLAQLRPSVFFESLVSETEDLQKQLDQLLGFPFADPLIRTMDRLRPALGAVLDDVTTEFDKLLKFLQKAA